MARIQTFPPADTITITTSDILVPLQQQVLGSHHRRQKISARKRKQRQQQLWQV
jgi:hypothetical protein